MNPLPPYDESAKCPKCKHHDVATTFHAESTGIYQNKVIERLLGVQSYIVPYDFLHRACTRCGYDWAEAPADS